MNCKIQKQWRKLFIMVNILASNCFSFFYTKHLNWAIRHLFPSFYSYSCTWKDSNVLPRVKDTPYGILGDTLNKKETYNRRETFWTIWWVPEPANNPCPNNCHLEAKYDMLCNRVKLHMQLKRTLNHITMVKCHVLS